MNSTEPLQKSHFVTATNASVSKARLSPLTPPIPLAKFTITQGIQSLQTYLSNPNKKRVFCRTCGSPIYSQRIDMPEIVRLRLGTVTQGDIPEISYEIFCESKAGWFQQDTKRPCYAQHKP